RYRQCLQPGGRSPACRSRGRRRQSTLALSQPAWLFPVPARHRPALRARFRRLPDRSRFSPRQNLQDLSVPSHAGVTRRRLGGTVMPVSYARVPLLTGGGTMSHEVAGGTARLGPVMLVDRLKANRGALVAAILALAGLGLRS